MKTKIIKRIILIIFSSSIVLGCSYIFNNPQWSLIAEKESEQIEKPNSDKRQNKTANIAK